MQVITGDETGLLKLVDLKARTYLKYGEQSRASSISDIMYLGNKNILSIKADSILDIYSIESSLDVSLRLEKSCLVSVENPVSCCSLIKNNLYSDNTMLIYNTIGSVSVYNISQDYNIKNITNFNVRGPLEASDTCNDGGILFGGKENDAILYNIETQQEAWVAKNVSQDKLHLRVPIWITSLSFQNPLQDSTSGSVFYSGTAYKHVRLYDTKASQRPIVSLEIPDDYRVSAIQPFRTSDNSIDDKYVYVADTAGGITLWDMRQQRRLHVLKGAAGSIRKMTLHNDGKYLACVGLDRFLRVYDTQNNKIHYSMYLKNRLNACLFVKRIIDTKTRVKKIGKNVGVRTLHNEGNDGDILEEIYESDGEDDDEDEEVINDDEEEDDDDEEVEDDDEEEEEDDEIEEDDDDDDEIEEDEEEDDDEIEEEEEEDCNDELFDSVEEEEISKRVVSNDDEDEDTNEDFLNQEKRKPIIIKESSSSSSSLHGKSNIKRAHSANQENNEEISKASRLSELVKKTGCNFLLTPNSNKKR